MTPGQQHLHRYIWGLISLALPVLLLLSVRQGFPGRANALGAVPEASLDRSEPISVVLAGSDSSPVLQLRLHTALPSASALVCTEDAQGRIRQVAQLGAAGEYRIEADHPVRALFVVDAIKKDTLYQTRF